VKRWLLCACRVVGAGAIGKLVMQRLKVAPPLLRVHACPGAPAWAQMQGR
jgi:lactate dehydrogenase-like 2-hydroxyacid dehydrogenase